MRRKNVFKLSPDLVSMLTRVWGSANQGISHSVVDVLLNFELHGKLAGEGLGRGFRRSFGDFEVLCRLDAGNCAGLLGTIATPQTPLPGYAISIRTDRAVDRQIDEVMVG